MKQYLISEEEIEYLLNYISNHSTQKMIKSIIKSKTPVEVIASGKVITIGVLDKFKGALSFNIGKSGTLIFVEDKEIK